MNLVESTVVPVVLVFFLAAQFAIQVGAVLVGLFIWERWRGRTA